jgi:hypothetical protein
MQVARRPLECYRGGLRDEDHPRTARGCLWMRSGGLTSVFVGGLLKTARLHVCRGCRELAAAPTAFLGFGSRPEQQCSQLSRGGLAGFRWYASWLRLAGSWYFRRCTSTATFIGKGSVLRRSSLCSVLEEHSTDFRPFCRSLV